MGFLQKYKKVKIIIALLTLYLIHAQEANIAHQTEEVVVDKEINTETERADSNNQMENEKTEEGIIETINIAKGKNDPTWDNPPDWFPSEDDVVEESDSLKRKKIDEELDQEKQKLENMSEEELERIAKEEEAEFSRKVVAEMGIDKMEIITKEVFREYLTRIIFSTIGEEGKDDETTEDPEEEEFLNMLIEEIMKEIPDKFPKEDFEKYADTDRYKDIVDKILKEKFGENYGDDMMKMMSGAFEGSKEGMPNMEDLESMMKEFKTTKGEEEEGGENDSQAEGEKDIPAQSEYSQEMMGRFKDLKSKIDSGEDFDTNMFKDLGSEDEIKNLKEMIQQRNKMTGEDGTDLVKDNLNDSAFSQSEESKPSESKEEAKIDDL